MSVIVKGIRPKILKQIDKNLFPYIVNMNDESIFTEFQKIMKIICDGGIIDV